MKGNQGVQQTEDDNKHIQAQDSNIKEKDAAEQNAQNQHDDNANNQEKANEEAHSSNDDVNNEAKGEEATSSYHERKTNGNLKVTPDPNIIKNNTVMHNKTNDDEEAHTINDTENNAESGNEFSCFDREQKTDEESKASTATEGTQNNTVKHTKPTEEEEAQTINDTENNDCVGNVDTNCEQDQKNDGESKFAPATAENNAEVNKVDENARQDKEHNVEDLSRKSHTELVSSNFTLNLGDQPEEEQTKEHSTSAEAQHNIHIEDISSNFTNDAEKQRGRNQAQPRHQQHHRNLQGGKITIDLNIDDANKNDGHMNNQEIGREEDEEEQDSFFQDMKMMMFNKLLNMLLVRKAIP